VRKLISEKARLKIGGNHPLEKWYEYKRIKSSKGVKIPNTKKKKKSKKKNNPNGMKKGS